MPLKKQARRYQTEPTDEPVWASEPFRVFFPLGILASVVGTLMWPLFFAKIWPFAPHLQHPRVMIFGFGFAFVVGFLGTAWPRFLESRALHRIEVVLLIITWLIAQGSYFTHQLRLGDFVFAAHALVLLMILSGRLRSSDSMPPPGFALAFASVALGLLVAVTWAVFPVLPDPQVFLFTKLVAWQGMLLLPLLGVGSYLFPRFFQVPGERPTVPNLSNRMLAVWGTALIILISFAIEAWGWIRIGNSVRFAGVLVWAIFAAPAVWMGKAPTTRAWGLRCALGSIAISFLVRAIWPGPGFAIQHLLFLGGFGLALLLVADRVSIGHGGDISSIPKKSKLWRWLIWLGLLTAATRVSADMKESLMMSHYIYAALMWIIIAAIWCAFEMRFWKSKN